MKELSINLTPKIVLPKDEDGKPYIGVYLDGNLVAKVEIEQEIVDELNSQKNSWNNVATNTYFTKDGDLYLQGVTFGKNSNKSL